MAQTIVQLRSPAALRGRVIGLYSMASMGFKAFSGLTVGVVGGLIGVHWSLALSAMVLMAITLALFAFSIPGRGKGSRASLFKTFSRSNRSKYLRLDEFAPSWQVPASKLKNDCKNQFSERCGGSKSAGACRLRSAASPRLSANTLLSHLLAQMGDNIEHVISYWLLYQKFHSPVLGRVCRH